MERSIEMYKGLLSVSSEELKEFTSRVSTFETQFSFSEFNRLCYLKIYEEQRGDDSFLKRTELLDFIPNLKETCNQCWKYYLNQRSDFIRKYDILYGIQFQELINSFLATVGIMTGEGDVENKNYPDNVVLDNEGNKIAYFEMKYLTAPFVFAYKKVKGRECYEGSTTLDVGKKIQAQREVIEKEIEVPSFYVYWLDYPCIKGVFYMPSNEVFSYIDGVGLEWQRKTREGDFEVKGGKKVLVSHIKKIYLPLLSMGNFEEFVAELNRILESGQDV